MGIKVIAYCLMTNHVHLPVAPEEAPCNSGQLMQAITARMTRYRNNVEGRTGTLWESRFIRTFASWIQDLPMPYGVNATSRRDTPSLK
ncbi:hypothetical protein I5P86_08285 [Pseudomonas glycinae]|nr:hypothetical protein [Pseudomonas glycinae]